MNVHARIWCVAMAAATAAVGCGDNGTDGPELGTDVGLAPDQARACSTNSDCDDGLFCNGSETCTGEVCTPGVGVECDDGIACTRDFCAEDSRTCQSAPPDVDGDGVGDVRCLGLAGEPLGQDCDDNDIGRFPTNGEVCDVEGKDEDCDEATFGTEDRDGDGYVDARCCNELAAGGMICGNDCNDVRPEVNPSATEACDGLDNDCDREVDERVELSGFVDADFDGIGGSVPTDSCGGVAGFSTETGDCDDSSPAVFPNAPELCDVVDNDCDARTDEARNSVDWFADNDGDGFGDPNELPISSCELQPMRSLRDTDCDDDNASINPAAAEQCDGIDNNCNGRRDFEIGINDFEDDDEDGRVDVACRIFGTDCDDQDAATGAGSAEVCDGRDNDCDERVDEDAERRQWFRDMDADGYGSLVSGTTNSCQNPPGFIARAGDCNDTNPARSPAAVESCNAVDDDCDGATDEAPGMTCPMGSGGEPGICVGGSCTLACPTARGNCDGLATNGCEVSTRTSPLHCGGCGISCPAGTNGTGACVDSACGFACDSGFADCTNGSGCETPILSNANHCGGCGVTCGAGSSCQAGFCDRGLQLAVSNDFACMRRENRALVCWGYNQYFRIGVNGPATAVTPPAAPPAAFQTLGLVDVAVGPRHSCGINAVGAVVCWGQNHQRQLGFVGPDTATPTLVTLPTAAVDIVVGEYHSCAVGQNTQVYCWGEDFNGQLGNSTTSSPSATPLVVQLATSGNLTGAVSLASSEVATCALTQSGNVFCWGTLAGDTQPLANTLPATTWTDVQELVMGSDFGCVRRGTVGGSIECWGNNAFGVFRSPASGTFTQPQQVLGVTNPRELYAGLQVLCARNESGVFCRGRNDANRLGTFSSQATLDRFEGVAGSSIITELADGSSRAVAICGFSAERDAYCWGDNPFGLIVPMGGATISSRTRITNLTRTAPSNL